MLARLRAWMQPPTPDALLDRARGLAKAGEMAAALAIWRPLAEAGTARAQTNLGACYANGAGMPADRVQARHWLERGAEGGDVLGQRNLAVLLAEDDKPAAAAWYARAAAQGDATSQDELSRMLLDGDGVMQDWAEARRLAERAARQSVTAAAHRCAMMCHEAKGGPRDPVQAARWWREAAEAGHADAAAMLGAALHMGQGVLADQVAAMTWLLVGSGRHSVLVRPFFARVEAVLSPEERVAAEDAARAYGWTG